MQEMWMTGEGLSKAPQKKRFFVGGSCLYGILNHSKHIIFQ